MTTYYQLFGISENATAREIKKAYKTLAKRHHPDKNQDNKKQASELFKEINTAYQILSDPHKKSLYDQRIAYARFIQQQPKTQTYTNTNQHQSNQTYQRNTTTTYHGAYTTFYSKDKFKKRPTRKTSAQPTNENFWLKVVFASLFLGGTLLYIGIIEYNRSVEKEEKQLRQTKAIENSAAAIASFYDAINSKDFYTAKEEFLLLEDNPYAHSSIDELRTYFATVLWDISLHEKKEANYSQALLYFQFIEELSLRYDVPTTQFEYCLAIYDCLLKEEKTEEAVKFFIMNVFNDIDLYNAHYMIGQMYENKNKPLLANKHFTAGCDIILEGFTNNYGHAYLVNPDLFINDKQTQILLDKSRSDISLKQYLNAEKSLNVLIKFNSSNISALELMITTQRELRYTDSERKYRDMLASARNNN